MRPFILSLIRLYQRWVSPAFPSTCRFYPSCSTYALEAVETYGVFVGGGMALKRLCRCHPFHPGGYDPVPHAGHQDGGNEPCSQGADWMEV